MSTVNLEFHGVHIASPEEFFCAVLRWPANGRIVPVWLSPVEGGKLAARHSGYAPRRPDTHDLLISLLESTGGVERIEITSCYEGVFIVDITIGNGESLDAKLSDALIVSEHFSVPVEIDEELLQQVAVYASQDDLLEYLDLDLPTPVDTDAVGEDFEHIEEASASGDAQADADFSEMMRSLGMNEEDFLQGEDDPEDK